MRSSLPSRKKIRAAVPDVGDEGLIADDQRGGERRSEAAGIRMLPAVLHDRLAALLDRRPQLLGVVVHDHRLGELASHAVVGRVVGACRCRRGRLRLGGLIGRRQGARLIGVLLGGGARQQAHAARLRALPLVQPHRRLVTGRREELLELLADVLHREPARHLTGVITAHAVRHDEDAGGVTIVLHDLREAHILILLALLADIGFCGCLEVQRHATFSLVCEVPGDAPRPRGHRTSIGEARMNRRSVEMLTKKC